LFFPLLSNGGGFPSPFPVSLLPGKGGEVTSFPLESLGMSREKEKASFFHTQGTGTLICTLAESSVTEKDEEIFLSNQKESGIELERKLCSFSLEMTDNGWMESDWEGDFSVSSNHVSMMMIVFSLDDYVVVRELHKTQKTSALSLSRGIRKIERQDFSSLPLSLTT